MTHLFSSLQLQERGALLHPDFGLKLLLTNICLGWPQTEILYNIASWVAEITGVYHYTWT
jgi:hypothetical protein